MRGRVMALAVCLLMLSVVPHLARADGWEQVPSGQGAHARAGIGSSVLSGMAASLRGRKKLGCGLAGKFAEDTAKLRDKGVSEQAQLNKIDDPHGTFGKLASASRLTGDTAAALRTTLHRAVVYVYSHPDMTPAQLRSHWQQSCREAAGGG